MATPGDSITYTFKVNNDGDYDAKLTGLTLNTPSCTGTDSTSNTNVCGKLRYTLKYENGTSVAQNDMLASKESKTMVLKLEYQEFDDASLLPTANVTIGNLGIDLVYTQEGKAKTNSDGTTPYVDPYSHHVGDTFTLNGDSYHIIADSPTTDDYVVALKDTPFSTSDLYTYAGGLVNRYTFSSVGSPVDINGDGSIGGMAYYSRATCGYPTPEGSLVESGCESEGATSYANSEVKYAVDAWAAAKFSNSELKRVNGYSARLIKQSEYVAMCETTEYLTPSSSYVRYTPMYDWQYNSNYEYWTMSPNGDSTSEMMLISSHGGIAVYIVNGGPIAVRPVINVKKSALPSS